MTQTAKIAFGLAAAALVVFAWMYRLDATSAGTFVALVTDR